MKKLKGLYKNNQLFGLVPPTELSIQAPLEYNLETITKYYYCPFCKTNFPWQIVKGDSEPENVCCAICKMGLTVIND